MARREKRLDSEGNVEKTAFGKLLQKATKFVPSLAGEVFDVVVKGESPIKAVSDLIKGMKGEAANPDSELNPQSRLELQALIYEAERNEREYEAEIFRLRTDIYRAEVEDRNSARNMKIQLATVGKSDWLQYVVGIIVLMSFMYIIYLIAHVPGISENPYIPGVLEMVKVLVTAVVFYYFGSSSGSKQKNDMIMRKDQN